jgi:hypothetical protein
MANSPPPPGKIGHYGLRSCPFVIDNASIVTQS